MAVDLTTAFRFEDIAASEEKFRVSFRMSLRLNEMRNAQRMRDCLEDDGDKEDSLTYSPLKDVTNKENSPIILFNGLDKVRKSPSTARLLALFGNTAVKNDTTLATPEDSQITPRRLQDFWDTPSKPGLDDLTIVDEPKMAPNLPAEIDALRASLLLIQNDCEFHRQRAVSAHDQLDHLNKYVAVLEEEIRKSRDQLQGARDCAPVEDQEKKKLFERLNSMETLNKSLARQNDLLRSRSSIHSRFEKKDVKIQTDAKQLVTTSSGVMEIPPVAPQRSEIHLDHVIGAPAVKVSRVLYIKDAESQTDALIWGAALENASRDISPFSNPIRLPIAPRYTPYDALQDRFTVLPLPDSTPREVLGVPLGKGYPYRTAQRARRSLPAYNPYPNSPSPNPRSVIISRRRSSVPKPLLASISREPALLQHDESPTGWQAQWRAISSTRRGKSTGSVSRPKWIP